MCTSQGKILQTSADQCCKCVENIKVCIGFTPNGTHIILQVNDVLTLSYFKI